MLALADVAVSVADGKASAAWWAEKVGFRVHTLAGAAHAILVAPPGERFVIHLCESFEPVSPGNTGIAFMTDDLAGTVRRMTAQGVAFIEMPQRETGGRMAKFSDPDGNVFWLLGAPSAFVRRAMTLRAAPARAVRGRVTGRASRTPARTSTRRATRAGRAPGRRRRSR